MTDTMNSAFFVMLRQYNCNTNLIFLVSYARFRIKSQVLNNSLHKNSNNTNKKYFIGLFCLFFVIRCTKLDNYNDNNLKQLEPYETQYKYFLKFYCGY